MRSRFIALLASFALLYLADYSLTLAATERTGFHELNPLADYWNSGNHETALYLKLAGLAVVLPLFAALHRTNPQLAQRTILNATLFLLAIDATSIVQLGLPS